MMTKFGVLVKVLRVRMGWSQDELAEKMHMSKSAISRLENDQKTLDLPTLMQLVQLTNSPEVVVAILCGMDGINILPTILQLIGG